MKAVFLFLVLLHLCISRSPTNDDSECITKRPTSPEDCYSQYPEFPTQTCCYFEGRYQDENGTWQEGPACLEAYRQDVSTGAKKRATQKKIEAGTYWEDYPPITNINSFMCFDTISECEKKQPAESIEDCFSSAPELLSENCCYMEADWVDDHYTEPSTPFPYCLDVAAADTETEDKLEETKNKILNASYWEGETGHPTVIRQFVCPNTEYVYNSPCVKKQDPGSPEECFALDTEFGDQTCCYFEGRFLDLDGVTYKEGPACLEATKYDVATGDRRAETLKKIEQGKYWDGYPAITNIQSFYCYNAISECEKLQPVTSEEECFNAKAELNTEGCCYIEGEWIDSTHQKHGVKPYCIDIKLEDSATKEKMEVTKNKLEEGRYWEGETGKFTPIKKFVCGNTKDSAYIKLSIMLLSIFAVLLF